MTNSDLPLESIDLQKAYKNPTKPNWIGDKVINAFDTETCNGMVFMLSFAIDEFSGVIGNKDVSELERNIIWDKITHNKCRTSNAINVWYNLDFDANALLSGILSQDALKHLAITNETPSLKCRKCQGDELERDEFYHTCENCGNVIEGIVIVNDMEYEITYVKGKFLFIKDIHGNRYEHYDISQFFYTSLDNASNEWLGKEKIDTVETALFGSVDKDELIDIVNKSDNVSWQYLNYHYDITKGDKWTVENAKSYIKKHYSEIKEYAEKDAILTKELANALVNEAENLEIPMGKPFSTGYLSAEYLRANMEKKPKFGSMAYQQFFWESYFGGRFEVFKRGNVGEVVAPDINSAYPAIMSELPSPDTLFWEYRSNEQDEYGFNDGFAFDIEDLKDADYGSIRVEVTTNPDANIQPFAMKNTDYMTGKVHYPILTSQEITVILPIFLFAVENNLVVDYELREGWLGYVTDETEYPFNFLKDLYAQRKLFEKQGFEKKGQLLKIVLNSAYGKTCQTTGYKYIKEIDENEIYELSNNEQIFPIQFMALEPMDIINEEMTDEWESVYPKKRINKNIREIIKDNEYVIESFHCGRRFNPFFATYITGLTRLELHKQVVNHNLEDNVIMFATDSIMLEKDAYEKSSFDELIFTPNEDLENTDKFLEQAKKSLGSWDFDYQGKAFVIGSGVYEVELDNGEIYRKTRGFLDKSFEKPLTELAKENPYGIPLENRRPLTINEVLINPERGSVSEFIKHEKTLLPDFDDKRYWNNENPDFNYLLNNCDNSEPINLILEQEDLIRKVQSGEIEIESEKGNITDM